MTKNKWRWFKQLDTCYVRGWESGDQDRQTGGSSVCPYKTGGGSVQRQRSMAWRRGYNRGKAGKPVCDING